MCGSGKHVGNQSEIIFLLTIIVPQAFQEASGFNVEKTTSFRLLQPQLDGLDPSGDHHSFEAAFQEPPTCMLVINRILQEGIQVVVIRCEILFF